MQHALLCVKLESAVQLPRPPGQAPFAEEHACGASFADGGDGLAAELCRDNQADRYRTQAQQHRQQFALNRDTIYQFQSFY